MIELKPEPESERCKRLNIISSLIEKLCNREYRQAYVASQINVGIPFQIRALMKARGMTQERLSEISRMAQPSISALITPGKASPNIKTLRRLADAFDCALSVSFVPFSDLVRRSEEFDPESFNVPSFNEDLGFIKTRPPIPEYLRSRQGYVWTADDTEFVLGRMQQITRTWGDIVSGLREGRLK